jgi:hypothetical protein
VLIEADLRSNHVITSSLGRPAEGNSPSEQEKVTAAERAAVRQKDPMQSFLDGVSHAYSSKLYRSAMWAPCQEHNLL